MTRTELRYNCPSSLPSSTIHRLGDPEQGLVSLRLGHQLWKLSTTCTHEIMHSWRDPAQRPQVGAPVIGVVPPSPPKPSSLFLSLPSRELQGC